MKKSIRFIYFDIGDVVLSNQTALEKAAKTHGVKSEDIYSIFEKNWRDGCRGTLNNADYMALFQPLHITHPSNDITEFWSDFPEPIHETHELIHKLTSMYQLGILSNAERGAIEKSIRKGNIPNIQWSVIIESAQHGTIKPEAKIYEIAEKAAGVSPEEIFFIDDVPEHITAAQSRGWQGMVFDTNDVEGSVKKLTTLLL